MKKLKTMLLLFGAGGLMISSIACEEHPQADVNVAGTQVYPNIHQKEAPLSAQESRVHLTAESDELATLRFAMQVARALPADPHFRDRCRLQHEVVKAMLQVDRPKEAEVYIPSIENWRRQAAYASLAKHHAQNGHRQSAQECIDRAEQFDSAVEDWQREHILALTLEARLELDGKTEMLPKHVEEQRLVAATARTIPIHQLGAALDALRADVDSGNLDLILNAHQVYAALYGRFYDDAEWRERCERHLRDSQAKLPRSLQIDVLLSLANHANTEQDSIVGMMFVDEARDMLEGSNWLPEDFITLATRIARVRAQLGDIAKARTEIQHAMSHFDAELNRIMNIDRADALRSIAEAFMALSDRESALANYARSLEAGVENPNSRPRTEDLVLTSISVAVNDVELTAAMASRMLEIFEGLGTPW